jgi:hypothetical protein
MGFVFDGPHYSHPVGSTGNSTGSSVSIGANYQAIAMVFTVSAIGATPTVTWKFQGSIDGTNWFDVAYITDAVDTLSVATEVDTTVSQSVHFLANPSARKYKFFRCVTSANTNVTYNSAIYRVD